MIRKLLLLIPLLAIAGCDEVYVKGSDGWDHEVVAIDGCEYLKTHAGSGSALTHKGNCHNPIHVYRAER